jgi:hypothetical protein
MKQRLRLEAKRAITWADVPPGRVVREALAAFYGMCYGIGLFLLLNIS